MIRRLRTALFWLHLAAGVSAAAIIIVMSATGVLLAFQPQLQRWADVQSFVVPVTPPAPPLPTGELLGRVAARGGEPTSILFRSDPHAPVEIVYGLSGSIYVARHDGTVLGAGSAAARDFFTAVTAWHRWLGGTADLRDRGRAVTGAANAAFLFMILSGFWLWWPRNVTWPAVRSVLIPRRGLRPKARDFNLHNVAGIWSLVPLAVIAATGVVLSYPSAGDVVQRIVIRDEAPPPPLPPARPEPVPVTADRIDVLLERVTAAVPDWRTAAIPLEPTTRGVAIAIESGTPGQPQHRSTLRVDPVTGAVLSHETFADVRAATRLRSILRYAHTGELLGVPGQAVAALACLGALLLAWTGLSLALRRLNGRLRRMAGTASLPLL